MCVRAARDRRRLPAEAAPAELADLFCRNSRRRVETLFGALQSNDDPAAYRVGRDLLDGRFAWLEEGILPAEAALPERARAAVTAVAAGAR